MPIPLHCQPAFSVANYALLWKRAEICIHPANNSCMWSVFRCRSCRSCYINITELQGRTLWCSQETWNRHLGVSIAAPVNPSRHIWSRANHLSSRTHSSRSLQLSGQPPSATAHLPCSGVPDVADHLAESTFLTAVAFAVTPPPPANLSQVPASEAPHHPLTGEM